VLERVTGKRKNSVRRNIMIIWTKCFHGQGRCFSTSIESIC